jgi:DNA-binding NarL/FixJ family response regulator
MKIQVIIADDHPMTREGIRRFLQADGDIDIIAEASNGLELLSLLEKHNPAPDIALVDVRMPRLDGLEATKTIRQRFPNVRVLILSAFDERELVFSAVEAGARGYILKDRPADQLIEAVRAVVGGEFVVDPQLVAGQLNQRAG